MSDIVILTGPPGAGKSTVARRLAAGFPRAVHLHTDDFWHAIASGGIAPHLPESDAQNQTVVRAIAAAARIYADGGFTTIVDGIVGPWMLHHYAPLAEAHPLHYIVLRPDREVSLLRAQGRTEADALVDAGPIRSLWDQFADLGGVEHHALDTTGLGIAETHDAVAALVRDRTHLLL